MTSSFVGSCIVQIRDDVQDVSFPTCVLYPTEEPAKPVAFGPYTVNVAPDAKILKGERYPLVVISHGTGGSHLLYRTLAMHLVKHGFVVAAPEHPGNNRNDNSLGDSDENLTNRPRHISLVLDALTGKDKMFATHVNGERVALIGHSMGAYTALAVAGGKPVTKIGQPISVKPDPRVKSLVLLAPVAYWYVPDGALRSVTAPILMFGGDEDTWAPTWHAHLILAQVPDKSRVTYRLIEHAGHYSFLSPFPDAMKTPTFVPALDPPGFDREGFHEALNIEVCEFLERTLI